MRPIHNRYHHRTPWFISSYKCPMEWVFWSCADGTPDFYALEYR
jgi:hypothetical protein